MLKAVFFDLDGTLLPMDEEKFVRIYFKFLFDHIKHRDYYDEQKFYADIFTGVKLMMKNDGTKTNEEVFWGFFEQEYGPKVLKDKPLFEEFYKNKFKETKFVCEENPLAKDIVSYVRKNNLKCILSTNPIFPQVGTETRMSFIGLNEDDFDYVTTYENTSFAKPNPKYFETLLNKFNLKPEEVILFGNNTTEDYDCASKANIKCYLVGNHIIGDVSNLDLIKMDEIIPVIESHLK